MTENLFAGLDVASASNNPLGIPPGTYRAFLTSATIAPTSNGDKVGMTLLYTLLGKLDDDGVTVTSANKGRTVKEWQHIPRPSELVSDNEKVKTDAERSMGFLKRRLKTLGIPESEMNTLTADDIVGKHVNIGVRPGKNGYDQVTSVMLVNEEAAGWE